MDDILFSVPPVLTIVLLFGLAVIALAGGRQTPANRLLALLCLMGSLLYIDIVITLNAPSMDAALRANRIGHLFHPFLIPLFVHFFHAYLGIRDRRWLLAVAYFWAGALAAASQTPWLIAGMRRFYFGYFGQGGPLYLLMGAGAGLVTVYNLFILYRAMQRETNANQKNKLKYVLTGFGLTGVLTSLNILTMFGLPIYPLGCFAFIPMGIFGAGVFWRDLLDMGLLIRKSLIYSMLTGLLTGLYALIVIGGQMVFKETLSTDSILFPLVLFALITFTFGPVKTCTQGFLDRLFAKDRYDYQQTIKQVSRTIATILDYDTITRLLKETLIDTMGVKRCALYLKETSQYRVYAEAGYDNHRDHLPSLTGSSELIAILVETGRPILGQQLRSSRDHRRSNRGWVEFNQLQAEVVLPMQFKAQLKGFLVLGEKRSGDLFTREDLDLLETLCHQSALAIENTQAYQALNELNRSLEAKVMARTQDLAAALEEKERTQEQLIRAESLAALGQLVAGVAHELNNPLTSVTSLLQSVLEELQEWQDGQLPDEDLIDDLHFADKELGRAKSIVASLLGLARQTQTYEEAVEMNLVIKDALQILHNQYKYTRVELVQHLKKDLPAIQGNFANLGQVVLNVIQNAFQAVSEGTGRIVLTTDYDPGGRCVVFRCRDNGPGIGQAIRQDVFKPFFTTKPVGQGTGLGLYICHEIITKHGGTIAIDPTISEGTQITICLPDREKSKGILLS